MGEAKQLMLLKGTPVIRHCLEALVAAGIGRIVVVLGPRREEIAAALGDLPATIAVNDNPSSDMAASVRIGLAAVGDGYTGVLVCPADHPLVAPATLRGLVEQHAEHPGAIIVPLYQGKRGHPTLFPFNLLFEIDRAASLRDIIAKDPGRVRHLPVDDRGVVLDMDTREDYRRLRELLGETAQ